MPTNRINATLADADRDAVLVDLQKAHDKLPFAVNLTAAERNRLARIGDADLQFTRRAIDAGRLHPGVLPRQLDLDAATADLTLRDRLEPIRLKLLGLYELVRDTQRLADAEAFAAARDVYAAMQRSRHESEAIDAIVRELAQHFDRPARPDEGPSDGEAPVTP